MSREMYEAASTEIKGATRLENHHEELKNINARLTNVLLQLSDIKIRLVGKSLDPNEKSPEGPRAIPNSMFENLSDTTSQIQNRLAKLELLVTDLTKLI